MIHGLLAKGRAYGRRDLTMNQNQTQFCMGLDLAPIQDKTSRCFLFYFLCLNNNIEEDTNEKGKLRIE